MMVPLVYTTGLKTVNGDFRRTKLVPRAALERAKVDKDFGNRFAHSIALAYGDEMERYSSGPSLTCHNCKDKAVTVLQLPTADFLHEPPLIFDWVRPVCSKTYCINMGKNSQLNTMACMNEIVNRTVNDIQNSETNNASIDASDIKCRPTASLPKICLHCGKIDRTLKRCSRCQKTYFCNVDCQRKVWPKHKKDCQQHQPAASSSSSSSAS